MAAKRNGIRTVLIPQENLRDLAEIDPVVRESLRFVAAETIDTVLGEALYPAETVVEPLAAAVQEPAETVITPFIPVEKQETPLRQ